MRENIEKLKTESELEDELMALKLKMALREYQEDEIERIMAEQEGDAAAKERLARGEAEMIRLIDRQRRKAALRHFTRRTLPRIGKIAACFLVMFCVGLTVALATMESARVGLAQFFLKTGQRYTSFGFSETEEYATVPSEWNGYYYPSYIPEGFKMYRTFSEAIEYVGPNQEDFVFSEHGPSTSGNIDTENAKISTIWIRGNQAMLVEKNDWVTIIWNVDNRCLIVELTGEKEEAIRIAESVVMIRE